MTKAIIALVLMLSMGTAMGDVYRWVDAQGDVHFSDRHPGANYEVERLRI